MVTSFSFSLKLIELPLHSSRLECLFKFAIFDCPINVVEDKGEVECLFKFEIFECSCSIILLLSLLSHYLITAKEDEGEEEKNEVS